MAGVNAMESRHFSTLTTRLNFLSPLKQVNDNETSAGREEFDVRKSIDLYLCG